MALVDYCIFCTEPGVEDGIHFVFDGRCYLVFDFGIDKKHGCGFVHDAEEAIDDAREDRVGHDHIGDATVYEGFIQKRGLAVGDDEVEQQQRFGCGTTGFLGVGL